MSESLATLEQQRDSILHQPHHPGHGPNYRLTRKVKGKTMTETFATPAHQRKAEREVDSYHRFRQLSAELLAVKEKICRVRPVESSLSLQEKKRQQQSSRKSRVK